MTLQLPPLKRKADVKEKKQHRPKGHLSGVCVLVCVYLALDSPVCVFADEQVAANKQKKKKTGCYVKPSDCFV